MVMLDFPSSMASSDKQSFLTINAKKCLYLMNVESMIYLDIKRHCDIDNIIGPWVPFTCQNNAYFLLPNDVLNSANET